MFLTTEDIKSIEETYRKLWNGKRLPTGGIAQAWHQAITKWAENNGDEIIPEHIRNREELCMNPVLAKQYVNALIDVCQDLGVELSEHQKAMLLITATAKEREAALQEVFGV